MQNQLKIFIQQYFKNAKSIQISNCNVFLKKYPQIKQKLENILKEIPEYQTIINIIKLWCKNKDILHCKICNKRLNFKKSLNDVKYCSLQCRYNDIQLKQNIKNKKEATCLAKFGVKCSFQDQNTKAKIRKTNLEKYQNEIPIKNEKIKQKMHNTNEEKYGAKCTFSSKQIREKIVKNTDYIARNKTTKQNCLKKYGIKNIGYLKTWKRITENWKQYIRPLFQLSQFEGKDKIYKWKCVKCGNIFEQKIYPTSFNKKQIYLPRCLKCYPFNKSNRMSKPEKQLRNFCKQYFPNLKTNNRLLIKPYQLDIVIDELKLAIEFNGMFWHDIYHVQKNFHLMKTELCEAKGYRLIHIWQYDWNTNKEEIKQKLIDIFSNNQHLLFKEKIQLDRDWYFKKNINGFILQIEQPKIEIIDGYSIEKTGKLIYKKI